MPELPAHPSSTHNTSNVVSPDGARHFSEAELDARVFLKEQFTRVPERRAISTGAFGNICLYYRGEDNAEIVAIKTPRYSDDEERNATVDRALKKDIKHLQLCEHPNILKYLGLYQGPNKELGIVCRYAEHHSLPTYLSKVQNADRLKIVREVAAGLAYLHCPDPAIIVDGKNISLVHGDLHPANVLIMEDNRAVLGDFGLSKLGKEGALFSMTDRGAGGAHGVAEYLAPEVHGEDDLGGIQPKSRFPQHKDYAGRRTPKADVFAFGMLIFTTFGGDVKAMIGRARTSVPIALIEGSRPEPEDTLPNPDAELIAQLHNRWALICECWKADAANRPAMDEVCRALQK